MTRIVRQSAVYAVGNVLAKAAGLILAPLFLNPTYLSLESYGYFAILMVTAQLAVATMGLGIGPGMLRFMTDSENTQHRDALPFTALVATLTAATLGFLLLFISASPLASLLLDSASERPVIVMLALYVAIKVVASVPMTFMRLRERAGLYTLAVALEVFVLVAAVYYLLAVRGQGLEGVVTAYAMAAALNAIILAAGLLITVRWRFSRHHIRPLIAYGSPLVIASLAGWFLVAGDRYLLKWLSDTASVGLYDWAARLGGVINVLFVQSFNLAFTVIGLKVLGSGERTVHRRVFRHYVIWTGFGVLGLSLFTFDLMKVMVGWFNVSSFYRGADTLVFPIALGFMAYGLYVVVNNVLYATGRTGSVGRNVVIAAVTNALFNIVLIPYLGPMGAALATVLSYAVLLMITAIIAEKEVHIGYPWKTALLVVVVVTSLYAVGWLTADWTAVSRLVARTLLLLSYFPLALVLRLYTREDLEAGRRYLARARRGKSGASD